MPHSVYNKVEMSSKMNTPGPGSYELTKNIKNI